MSFVVWSKDTPVLACLCSPINEAINFFGTPVTLIHSRTGSPDEIYIAYNIAFKKILSLAKENDLEKGVFFSNPHLDSLLLKYDPTYSVLTEAFVDLSLSEDQIRSSLRKSYKSLVNWGTKNLEIKVLGSESIKETDFSNFKRLHFDAAGRETRGPESWDAQFDAILQDRGFLVLAYKDGEPVSGVFSVLGTEEAFYGVAASCRELMQNNEPLGHAPLFKAILHSKALGLRRYILGPTSYTSKKEASISLFKLGFRTSISSQTRLNLCLELNNPR